MIDHFGGMERLTTKHAEQIAAFETWAASGDWSVFHHSHYDWWAYPINRTASALGNLFNVPPDVVDELKADSKFMRLHHRGLQLGALAWGWDIDRAQPVPNPASDQAWSHYPPRLETMACSAKLFGHMDYFASLRTYAADLKARGESFDYNGWDMYTYFDGRPPTYIGTS